MTPEPGLCPHPGKMPFFQEAAGSRRSPSPRAAEQGGKAAPRPTPVPTHEGRLMGWLPFFSWLPGTKYIFFLIGPAADGYLASRESERDFVSNAEK